MTSNELRDKFLNFFESKGHKRLPSASLVPKDDSSVLFTTAGMQQFRRFYAEPNSAPAPAVVTSQKCLRTSDIDEVGDSTHLTFFEMLGNFSFGWMPNNADLTQTDTEKSKPYFKKEAIEYAWEFFTEVLKIEKNRLSATYFKGEGEIPADNESLEIIKQVTGLSDDKIQGTGKDETFWSLGTEGSPGGPTVEFYIDGVEVWNLVFNQYTMQGGKYIPSKYQGVDTGMGFERLAAMMQGKDDVFETDLFTPVIAEIEKISGKRYLCHSERSEESHRDPSATPQDDKKAFRIIADHIKAATLLISEDVLPSNKDQGYIVRRLIRRAIVQANNIGIKENFTSKIATKIFEIYGDLYFDVIPTEAEESSDGKISRQARDDKEKIMQELEKEENKFKKTLNEGIRALKKIYGRAIGGIDPDNLPKGMVIESNKMKINGEELFNIYQTYGLPIEISQEIMAGWGIAFDQETIEEAFKKHQKLSRTASAGKFKGGLADAGEETTKLHTAAHLMLAAMRQVLGENVNQKGSNITAERLRFDFNYPEKLSDEQIKEIDNIVNDNIKADLPVTMKEMSVEEAKKSGATGVFDDRYGNRVKVYTIGPSIGSGQARSGSRDFISREICGGPHVERTGQLGHFKITKEESSSAGVRRVKAVLE